MHRIGWVGGYGIFVDFKISFGVYLPSDSRQINNTAELIAAVRALQVLPRGKFLREREFPFAQIRTMFS